MHEFEHDHRAVFLHIHRELPGGTQIVQPRAFLGPYGEMNIENKAPHLIELFAQNLKPIDWGYDVHRHAGTLTEQMHLFAQKGFS